MNLGMVVGGYMAAWAGRAYSKAEFCKTSINSLQPHRRWGRNGRKKQIYGLSTLSIEGVIVASRSNNCIQSYEFSFLCYDY